MNLYNTAYPAPNFSTNPYTANPYTSVPNPFANNPYMTQQPTNGQAQDFAQGQNQQYANQATRQTAQRPITSFYGKSVNGMVEAEQAEMLYDGSVNIYPDVGNGKIYTRQLLNDGSVAKLTYTLQPQNASVHAVPASQENLPAQSQTQTVMQSPAAPAVDVAAVVALQSRIADLETKINTYEGMFLNVQSNADSSNVNGKSKSNTNASTGGGK